MDQIVDQLAKWLADPVISKVGYFLIAVIVAIMVVRALQLVASRSIADTSARYRVRKFIGFAGYTIVALFLISSFSDRLGQLSVVFGVAGAGIAFSLQEVIASIAGWIAISLGGFYRIGDRVQLGGIRGDVIDIGMLRTTIMEMGDWVKGDNYNGRVVRVANSFVFKEPVYNYSGDFPFLWDEFTVPIRFGSDWRLAQTVIEGAVIEATRDIVVECEQKWASMVRKYMIEDARIAPSVTLVITDNWIEYTVRYPVNFNRRRATKDIIMRSLLEGFEVHPGKLEFASTTIELSGSLTPALVAKM
jgi:small-conductance mechanosensitive channel